MNRMNDFQLGLVREMVRKYLQNAHLFQWTLQGFGMLRLYFENDLRLAVWHNAYRGEKVSMLHDHPWDFESLIVTGVMRNRRYRIASRGEPYFESTIVAGEGGGLEGEPRSVLLKAEPDEEWFPGWTYRQSKEEIHESMPEDGTVTLCQRLHRNDDPDRARVFWRRSEEWGSAEPRKATAAEIEIITARALARMEEEDRSVLTQGDQHG